MDENACTRDQAVAAIRETDEGALQCVRSLVIMRIAYLLTNAATAKAITYQLVPMGFHDKDRVAYHLRCELYERQTPWNRPALASLLMTTRG